MEQKLSVMTGATGHVGYALLLELIKNNEPTRILIRKDSKIFDNIDCERVYGDAVLIAFPAINPSMIEASYSISKSEATQYVLDANGTDGLETVVVQPSACIGPYDFKVSSVGEMVRMYLKGQFPVSMSFGGYNFVDIRDVASGTYAAAKKGRPGECYILCGDVCTVDEFVKSMAKACGKKAP